MNMEPIIDRRASRDAARAQANAEARERGYADYTSELDEDYRKWQQRTAARAVPENSEQVAGYVVPTDPMDELGCDSCQ